RGLDVAVIGAPNVGKSLLTNQLVRAAVSSVSSKMDTTVQSPQQICLDSVRAALLDTVPSNVAYCLRPKICEWVEDGDVLKIVVEILCEKERIGRLVLGKGGQRITEIGRRVNDHMHNLFTRQLFVRVLIKHKGQIVNVLK
uniref:G domain-containing protein n=1 Tax=Angiostrongylus cantonensis TaxID=6313 RepID=A0A0K0DF30_ANGCA